MSGLKLPYMSVLKATDGEEVVGELGVPQGNGLKFVFSSIKIL